MIIKEIRVMRGPNMWSDTFQHLLVAKINNSGYDKVEIEKISQWVKLNTQIDIQNIFLNSNPTALMAVVISELAKNFQPNTSQLYADTRLLGTMSYYAISSYEEEEAGVEALTAAGNIVDAIIEGRELEPVDKIKSRIEKYYSENFIGPSTSSIVEAAIKRNIPVRKTIGGFITFGQGKFQKKIAASISENTSDISVDIAGDKDITRQILEEAKLPVPKGFLVSKEESLSEISTRLQFPVVVKPPNAHQRKGITGNVTNFNELVKAFQFAKTFSDSVIIEKHIIGKDFRFLVIGNKLVAVALRTRACVTGNGTSTIQQLIDKENQNPLRGEGHGNMLTKITVDETMLELLKTDSLTIDSVPVLNEIIYLKLTANLSNGGTVKDVTDEVHPENILMAERVASIIGLDICGIDIMAPDVTMPVSKNGGAILEVNAAPGLRMHLSPTYGTPRNIGTAIIDLLFPANNPARIPIVAITGTNGKTTTTRLMAHVAASTGFNVGFTTTDGIYIKNTQVFKGDCTGPQSTKLILQEPLVDFAVLECARGGIIRSGLAFDQCDIAIVTNVAADHLGLKDIFTVEDLANVKCVIPKSVSKNGYAILNANDDLVYNMKNGLKCNVALFAIDENHPRIAEHIVNGGVAVTIDENKNIIIVKDNKKLIVENVVNIPLTMDGKAEFMIENVLPVTLASYLLGFSIEKIKSGLTSFSASAEQTPGRLNKFDVNGVNVILDYAHNPHGLKALGKYLKSLNSKITGVVTGVGDRRDEDIIEVGKIAAEMYDEIIIRFDKDTRTRTPKQIGDLIIAGIQSVNENLPYHVIADSNDALTSAVENSKKGDYIVISADDTIDSIGLIRNLADSFKAKALP